MCDTQAFLFFSNTKNTLAVVLNDVWQKFTVCYGRCWFSSRISSYTSFKWKQSSTPDSCCSIGKKNMVKQCLDLKQVFKVWSKFGFLKVPPQHFNQVELGLWLDHVNTLVLFFFSRSVENPLLDPLNNCKVSRPCGWQTSPDHQPSTTVLNSCFEVFVLLVFYFSFCVGMLNFAVLASKTVMKPLTMNN